MRGFSGKNGLHKEAVLKLTVKSAYLYKLEGSLAVKYPLTIGLSES